MGKWRSKLGKDKGNSIKVKKGASQKMPLHADMNLITNVLAKASLLIDLFCRKGKRQEQQKCNA